MENLLFLRIIVKRFAGNIKKGLLLLFSVAFFTNKNVFMAHGLCDVEVKLSIGIPKEEMRTPCRNLHSKSLLFRGKASTSSHVL
jgi:hypothetical protein